MEYHKLPFSKLLEQYVFSVSKRYIEQVDEDAQNALINLFVKIGKETVDESLARKHICHNERIKRIERLIAIRQVSIEITRTYILRVDRLLKQVKRNITTKTTKKNLIQHYKSLRNRYVIYLLKLQSIQQKELTRLHYQYSI